MTHNELIEAAAKAIDPGAFKRWQGLYDHCLKNFDGEDYAKRCADTTYGAELDAARAKARAAASIIIEACATILRDEEKRINEDTEDYVGADLFRQGQANSTMRLLIGIRALAPAEEG